jgi:glycerophosphoryl diester phosphodiesterase
MLSRLLSLDVPVAIAHRGGAKIRPENTLAAFEHAAALGADAIECDVHLSADGEPVVIHDASLDRTTDRRGLVSTLSARQLAEVDAGAAFDAAGGFPYRGRGLGVPRLAEILDRLRTIPVIVEIKGNDPRTADRTLAVIREAGAAERVLIGGFSQSVLDVVRQAAPNVPTSASRLEVQAALRRAWFFVSPRRTGFEIFQVPVRLAGRRVLTRRFVTVARRAAVPVQAWIVDDPAEMRVFLDWGVTGLISDRPDLAIEAVRKAR